MSTCGPLCWGPPPSLDWKLDEISFIATLFTSKYSAQSSLPASELDCYKCLLNKKWGHHRLEKTQMDKDGVRQCHSTSKIIPSSLCSYLNHSRGFLEEHVNWHIVIYVWIYELMHDERMNGFSHDYKFHCCALCAFMVLDYVVLCHCPLIALLASLFSVGWMSSTPTHPPTAALEPKLPLAYHFPFLLLLEKLVLNEEAAWVKKQKPWYPPPPPLKNTIRTKPVINTHNWNKWQLTAENNLPAVGGRKLLTAGPHWVATEREEVVGENPHHHLASLQGCCLGPAGSVYCVSFTMKL